MAKRRPIAALAAVAAVCAAYGNHFRNGFHFDDFHTITDNPYIRSLHNIPRFFTDTTTFSVLPANQTYRPLVSASLAIDYALGHGYTPLWFHIGTFLIFLAQLALMYLLFDTILRKVRPESQTESQTWLPALLAVTCYGLHPAIAETVNYIIQRGDIYSTSGVVAALAIYARWPQWRRFGLYLLPFALAMLSKPPAVVFPALLFAYIAYFEGDEDSRWARAARSIVPSVVVAIAALVLQSAMTPKSFAPATLSGFDYRVTQPFVLLRYFGSFFLPLHLNVDSDLAAFDHFTANALWGFLFLAVMIAAIVVTARRSVLRPISFGLLWFLVASIPTSAYTLSEVENDHRMYMPFIGLVLAVVWALWLAVEKAAAQHAGKPVLRWTGIAAALLLLAYGYGTHVRNSVWHDEDSLWLDDVQKCPRNGRGLMIYGLSQMSKGIYPVALAYFQRAEQYTPNYPTLQINLGVVYGAMQQPGQAQAHFLRAIALSPQDEQAHFFYGRWLFSSGRADQAVEQLREAVRLNPSRLPARDLLQQALAITGSSTEAQSVARGTLAIDPSEAGAHAYLEHPTAPSADYWINASLARYLQKDYPGTLVAAQQALVIKPDSETAYTNIGAAYAGMGDWQKAIENERHALAIKPDFQLAKNNLAAYEAAQKGAAAAGPAVTPEMLLNQSLQLYQAHDYAGSLTAAQAALRLRPNFAEAWNNVAAAQASMGHWQAAADAATRAIALKPDFQLAKNNLAWALSELNKQHAGKQ